MVKANYPDFLDMINLAETFGYEVAIVGQSGPLKPDPRKYYALSLSKLRQNEKRRHCSPRPTRQGNGSVEAALELFKRFAALPVQNLCSSVFA